MELVDRNYWVGYRRYSATPHPNASSCGIADAILFQALFRKQLNSK
jgi:hypothetical protein